MTTSIDLVSGRVAKELGLSPVLVDQINRIQYKFLMDTMQSGSMSSVSMIYIGKFIKNKKYGTGKRNTAGLPKADI